MFVKELKDIKKDIDVLDRDLTILADLSRENWLYECDDTICNYERGKEHGYKHALQMLTMVKRKINDLIEYHNHNDYKEILNEEIDKME